MTKEEKKEIKDLLDDFKHLEDDLSSRVADLHEVQGGMAERHAFCYYRSQLWSIKYKLRDLID